MDYSLLRPFDLEAAKAGEELVCSHDGGLRKYVAGPDTEDKIIVADASGVFQKSVYYREHYAMAPLAWVEGKPVYKGDVLYIKCLSDKTTITGICNQTDKTLGKLLQCTSHGAIWEENLTWNPPKVKREGWVNVSNKSANSAWVAEVNGLLSHSYASKQDADRCALPDRIACVRIEWEE